MGWNNESTLHIKQLNAVTFRYVSMENPAGYLPPVFDDEACDGTTPRALIILSLQESRDSHADRLASHCSL